MMYQAKISVRYNVASETRAAAEDVIRDKVTEALLSVDGFHGKVEVDLITDSFRVYLKRMP